LGYELRKVKKCFSTAISALGHVEIKVI